MHARPWRSRSKVTAPPVWRVQLGRGSSRSSAAWVWVSVSYVTGSFRLDFLRCSCLLNYRTALAPRPLNSSSPLRRISLHVSGEWLKVEQVNAKLGRAVRGSLPCSLQLRVLRLASFN